MGKKNLTEEDIKLRYITPAITAKWKVEHIFMEKKITDGRVNIKGNMAVREDPKRADYVLCYRGYYPLAIVEAKDNKQLPSFGLQQAKTYCQMMDVKFAYSSNGDEFVEFDFLTGQERSLPLADFPSEDELWERLEREGKLSAEDEDYVSIIPEEYRWQNWVHEEKQGDGLTGDDLLDFVNDMFKAFKELEVTSETPLKKSIVKTVFEDTNQYMKDGVLLRQMANELDAIQLDQYEKIHALGDIYETILKDLQSAGHAGEFYTPRAVTDFMAKMIEPKLGEKMADEAVA